MDTLCALNITCSWREGEKRRRKKPSRPKKSINLFENFAFSFAVWSSSQLYRMHETWWKSLSQRIWFFFGAASAIAAVSNNSFLGVKDEKNERKEKSSQNSLNKNLPTILMMFYCHICGESARKQHSEYAANLSMLHMDKITCINGHFKSHIIFGWPKPGNNKQ